MVLRGSRVTAELTGRGCTGRSLGLSRASDAELELGDVTFWPRAGGGCLPYTLPGPSPEAANFSLYFLAAQVAWDPFAAALQVAGVCVAIRSLGCCLLGELLLSLSQGKTRKSIHEPEIEVEAIKQMSNYLSRWGLRTVCLWLCGLLEQPAAGPGRDCLGRAV